MIHAELRVVDWSGGGCDNPECSQLLEFHDRILNTYFLKQGTTCLEIWSYGSEPEYYCRSCIDVLYQKLKPILDTRLWAFK